MTEINVYDAYTLEPITEFSQYDSNRTVLIPKIYSQRPTACHFFNAQSDSAYVVESSGLYCADENVENVTESNCTHYKFVVPNDLLLQNTPIYIYLNITLNTETRNIYCAKIPVRKRPRPNDFVYESNSEYYSISEIDNRVRELAAHVESLGDTTIADGSIVTAYLADGSVTTEKLADAAVTSDKIARNSIESAKLVSGAITAGKIYDGAVITEKIADGAVTADKLAEDAITEIANTVNEMFAAEVISAIDESGVLVSE